jgi:hypothetical protein
MKQLPGAILMIGPSRAGKTYLAQAFLDMGLKAVDIQSEPGILDWRNNATGEVVEKSPLGATKEWYRTHHFLMDREAMEQYLSAHRDSIVLAHSWNILDCIDLFDVAYFMEVPEAELRRRMMLHRSDHRQQQNLDQIEFMLERHRERLADAKQLHIPILDVSQSPAEIYRQMERLYTARPAA